MHPTLARKHVCSVQPARSRTPLVNRSVCHVQSALRSLNLELPRVPRVLLVLPIVSLVARSVHPVHPVSSVLCLELPGVPCVQLVVFNCYPTPHNVTRVQSVNSLIPQDSSHASCVHKDSFRTPLDRPHVCHVHSDKHRHRTDSRLVMHVISDSTPM